MWTRSLLKTNAKTALKRSYWKSFLVCLVTMLLGGMSIGAGGGLAAGLYGGVTGGLTANEYVNNYQYDLDFPSEVESIPPEAQQYLTGILAVFGVVFLVAFLVAMAYVAFVGGPVEVGACRYFMENRYGSSPFETLFSAFRGGSYLHVVGVMFWRTIKIMLWSLLLIIPGIVKSYEYYFVPYLLAENPHLTSKRAHQLSRVMSNGEKWHIFVLELSFIGWYLLGMLAGVLASLGGVLGNLPFLASISGWLISIGEWCVMPYEQATRAELYAAMRAKVFAAGYSDPSELSDFVRYSA